MKKADFAKKYSPELQQKMRDRYKTPEIREAITFFVMQAVSYLGQVRSKKYIIGYLLTKLAPHGCTMEEVEYVYDMAQATYNNHQKFAAAVASNGNN